MRIVVIGANGRLGATMAAAAAAAGHDVQGLTRADLDVTRAERIASVMDRLHPEAVVNCSAYNAVDAAEREVAAAFAVNSMAAALLADQARARGIALVHYSTDFVFDGAASVPYVENDTPNPLSAYGASKLAGEHAVRTVPRHYILRVESLFGGVGVNGHRATVDVFADNIAAGSVVRAAVDRTVTLSQVDDVARTTLSLLEGRGPAGTYHCVCSGATTWYDLASEIAARLGLQSRIEPAFVADLPTIALRPRFCALSNQKLLALRIELPAWQTAVHRHLAGRGVAAAGPAQPSSSHT